LKKFLTLATAGVMIGAIVAPMSIAHAPQKSKKKKTSSKRVAYSGPETGLLGVRIYDSALRVISMYGNPDQISAVSISSGGDAGGGSGGGGRGGFGGAPGGGRGGGGGGGGSMPSPDAEMRPGDLVPGGLIPGGPIEGPDRNNFQGDDGGARPGFAPPGGPPGGGRGGGAPGAPGGPPGGAPGGGGGGGANESTTFTRWTYTRNGTKLGFVVDKFNRVVQIEAIGLQNQRVKTRRGVGFGSTFSTVMKSYGNSYDPDGYDISSNNFTVRFLTRGRVAFRLSRLSNKQAHVVTGIVVAAGKQ
jgi:hypothetical protein